MPILLLVFGPLLLSAGVFLYAFYEHMTPLVLISSLSLACSIWWAWKCATGPWG